MITKEEILRISWQLGLGPQVVEKNGAAGVAATPEGCSILQLGAAHDLHELLDGLEPIERLDDPGEIEGHVFVNDDVAKAGNRLELGDQVGGECGVASQALHRLGVILRTDLPAAPPAPLRCR